MTDEKTSAPPPFDFLKIANLGRRKKNAEDEKYASFNRRMLAASIDSLVLMIIAGPFINYLIPVTNVLQKYALDGSNALAMHRWLMKIFTDRAFIVSWTANGAAQLFVFCAFSAVCWHFWAATPGKMLVRIHIVDADSEQPITDKQIAWRMAGYFVSGVFLCIGFFWIGFGKRRQGWHDKMANTVVTVLPWRGFRSLFS